jgi:anti-sigma factor RsiW
MLSEQYRELLTAYVDGELSARQRRSLQKLLRRSKEARALLQKMQSDSDELRALAPARLKEDLSDSVLKLIAQRQIQPPRPSVPFPAASAAAKGGALWPFVVGVVGILLGLGVGAYFLFAFLLK